MLNDKLQCKISCAKFNILKDEVDNLAKHLFKHDINKRIQENTGENNMDIISKQRNIKNKKNLNVAYNKLQNRIQCNIYLKNYYTFTKSIRLKVHLFRAY